MVRADFFNEEEPDLSSRTSRKELLGKLSVARDGYGFVALVDEDGPDVFIPAHDMNGGCNGDMVRVRLTRESREDESEWSLGSKTKTAASDRGFAQGRSGCSWTPLTVPSRSGSTWRSGLRKPGDVVGVEITHYPRDARDEYVGIVTESFDDAARVTAEIDRLIYARDLPAAFPDEVMAEANRLPEEVNDEDKGGGRKDWRDLPFVTIDGEDARDFDDAVCLAPHGKGRRLYVAVADVSHYVQEGSPLDQEARLRGTSIYFPDRVIPMLPERLSNGLCSLNPHVDRLVMAVWFDLRKDGSIGKTGIEEAVIHSHARLTYTQVARLLNEEEAENPSGRIPPDDTRVSGTFRRALQAASWRGCTGPGGPGGRFLNQRGWSPRRIGPDPHPNRSNRAD